MICFVIKKKSMLSVMQLTGKLALKNSLCVICIFKSAHKVMRLSIVLLGDWKVFMRISETFRVCENALWDS